MRTLLILASIFLIYQIVFRFLIPYYIGKTLRKTQERMFGQFNNNQYGSKQKVGEMKVDYKPDASKGQNKNIDGEYVDFTEVK